MTPTLSILVLIGAAFAGACALRLLIRAALFIVYFAADLAAAPSARSSEPCARHLDRDLPALS